MDPVAAIQQAIDASLSEVNTMEPGIVVSYNPATNRAIVRPAMPRRLADDSILEVPNLYEVPVLWPVSSGGGANGVSMTMPIQPGDGVMIAYQQRSLDGWSSNNNAAPDDPRRHDISDAVAIPGLQARNVEANPTDLEIRFGQSRVRIMPDTSIMAETPGGALELTTDGAVLRWGSMRLEMGVAGAATLMSAAGVLTLNADGSATYTGGPITVTGGDVIADGISLKTHRHSGVQTGAGNTGTPIP